MINILEIKLFSQDFNSADKITTEFSEREPNISVFQVLAPMEQ